MRKVIKRAGPCMCGDTRGRREALLALAAVAITCSFPVRAFAQTPSAEAQTATNPINQAAESAGPRPPALTGDWGGLRTLLSDEGIDIGSGFRNEAVTTVLGGQRESAPGWFCRATGVTVHAEAGWSANFGPNALQGHYQAGFWEDTAGGPDALLDATGRPFVLTGLPPLHRDESYGSYVHRPGPGKEPKITARLSPSICRDHRIFVGRLF
jgi:carbohydrate-selective porin OprB